MKQYQNPSYFPVILLLQMAVYMSFPVMTFWYFNQPEFFEEWTIKMRVNNTY